MSAGAAATIRLPDGRTLGFSEAGDPDGLPVFAHHGTPSCSFLFEPWCEDAAANGIRLIGYDRAGYGASSRSAGRDIGAVAADIEALADALGIGRFATWGISGGGPHALACAALSGGRCIAAASLAGVAPWEAQGLDWLAGMGEGNVEEFDLVLAGEDALRPSLEPLREGMLAATPDGLREELDTLLGDADRNALTGAFAEWLSQTFRRGLGPSADGWLDDDLAFVKPWGFELAGIDRPTLIVQGGDDRFVPRAHGDWLAAHVPGAEARIDDADGHLTLLVNRVPEVHAWLLARS